jgi:hypothetical protein
MNIYWSPSIEIGISSIIIFCLGMYFWEKLVDLKPIRRSAVISIVGILSFFVYVLAHISIIYIIRGSGYDSPTIQLIKSFGLFSIFFSIAIFLRIKVTVDSKVLIFIALILIVIWTVNSILFNSGLPPYHPDN